MGGLLLNRNWFVLDSHTKHRIFQKTMGTWIVTNMYGIFHSAYIIKWWYGWRCIRLIHHCTSITEKAKLFWIAFRHAHTQITFNGHVSWINLNSKYLLLFFIALYWVDYTHQLHLSVVVVVFFLNSLNYFNIAPYLQFSYETPQNSRRRKLNLICFLTQIFR